MTHDLRGNALLWGMGILIACLSIPMNARAQALSVDTAALRIVLTRIPDPDMRRQVLGPSAARLFNFVT